MKEYVLDANALVRYFRKTPGSTTVLKLFEDAKAGRVTVTICVVNLAEVLYVLSKYFGEERSLRLLETAGSVAISISVDDRFALDTALLRIRYKLGLADCFAAELAIRRGATLVTADPDFAKLGKRLKILALPRHGE